MVKSPPKPHSNRAVPLRRPEKMNVSELLYYPAIFNGLKLTTKRLFENLFGRKHIVTVEYPEVKVEYPKRFRGEHRLMQRDDGTPRCVACMCCSTACPSNCITIVATEANDPNVEKAPASFDIDLLKCVYCGMCVEACPCDAIRMDSGRHPKPTFTRGQGIINLDTMLNAGNLTIAKQGGKFKSDHSKKGH